MRQEPESQDSKNPVVAFLKPLNPLALADPFRWLARGVDDFRRTPLIGLFFGMCFVGMGWALMLAFKNAPAYLLGLSAGFLLVGPFFCMGLYQVSQRLEREQTATLPDAIMAWDQHAGTMAIFGMVLLVFEMLWARASIVVFALATDGSTPNLSGSLTNLLEPENIQFVLAWLGLGAVFALLIFALCAISIPMILDQGTDAITAGLTSMRLVLEQPLVMLLWAALIAGIVVIAMLPGFIGLLIAGPVLGHASWHAYRAAVQRF